MERFFNEQRVRRPALVQARIEAIRTATALTDDPAVLEPAALEAVAVAEQLRSTIQVLKRFDAAIAELAPSSDDHEIFASFPGAGPVFTARVLVAFGEDRYRFRSADELQRYSGVAPVTERSGKSSWVHWRWACGSFVRQTFVEWAEKTVSRSYWASVYYEQQRGKGASHHVAIRALAFKWVRIMYRCWQTHTRYDETRYLQALRARGSPLVVTANA